MDDALKKAGRKLVEAAECEFPSLSTRCVLCGFRLEYHSPANHEYQRPRRAFPNALAEFVEQVIRLSEQS